MESAALPRDGIAVADWFGVFSDQRTLTTDDARSISSYGKYCSLPHDAGALSDAHALASSRYAFPDARNEFSDSYADVREARV